MKSSANHVSFSPITPRLAGKVAFVTGGSRGIGAGIVKRLAEEKAEVVFTYLKQKKAAEAIVKEVAGLGGKAYAVRADSGDVRDLETAIHQASQKFGSIDVLVSSAGALLFKPVDQFTVKEFDHIISVDLRAAFVASKAGLKHMGSGGRIIFISSNIADFAALPMTSLYSMVKAGLDGLAKGMARDLGPRGITVNTVHPGPIKTDANPENGPFSADLRRFMATPEYGAPEDVASMVAFLASPEAKFATGAAFVVDNGFTA